MINQEGYEYDIIYWDRHNTKEGTGARKVYRYNFDMLDESTKSQKLIGYYGFRRYVKSILNKEEYHGLVLLTTSVGMILYDLIIKQFKGRFILDIRDYTLENNKIYYYFEEKLINESSATVISSEGFKNFLPLYNYIIVHNSKEITKSEKCIRSKHSRKVDTIKISFIGFVRFIEQDKKFISKLGNDKRFSILYAGKGANRLKQYCEDNNFTNIELVDQFPSEKTLDFYEQTDLINNVYGNQNPLLDYALSNKLYYAANLKIPILVSDKTYMEEVTKKYKFGFAIDDNSPNLGDLLFNWYQTIDWGVMDSGCETFIEDVDKDNENFRNEIIKVLRSW